MYLNPIFYSDRKYLSLSDLIEAFTGNGNNILTETQQIEITNYVSNYNAQGIVDYLKQEGFYVLFTDFDIMNNSSSDSNNDLVETVGRNITLSHPSQNTRYKRISVDNNVFRLLKPLNTVKTLSDGDNFSYKIQRFDDVDSDLSLTFVFVNSETGVSAEYVATIQDTSFSINFDISFDDLQFSINQKDVPITLSISTEIIPYPYFYSDSSGMTITQDNILSKTYYAVDTSNNPNSYFSLTTDLDSNNTYTISFELVDTNPPEHPFFISSVDHNRVVSITFFDEDTSFNLDVSGTELQYRKHYSLDVSNVDPLNMRFSDPSFNEIVLVIENFSIE